MTTDEKVLYLIKKWDTSILVSRAVLRGHPNLDLNSKEMEMYIRYIEWTRTFLDGDKTIEHFKELHPKWN